MKVSVKLIKIHMITTLINITNYFFIERCSTVKKICRQSGSLLNIGESAITLCVIVRII